MRKHSNIKPEQRKAIYRKSESLSLKVMKERIRTTESMSALVEWQEKLRRKWHGLRKMAHMLGILA